MLRRRERRGVADLVGEPVGNLLGVAALPSVYRKRLAGRCTHQAIEFDGEARSVECGGILLLDAPDRAALHKEPLDRVERSELVVPGL